MRSSSHGSIDIEFRTAGGKVEPFSLSWLLGCWTKEHEVVFGTTNQCVSPRCGGGVSSKINVIAQTCFPIQQ